MKRTIPLLITFLCGMVLVAAHFSPYTQRWGEAAMIWFDILASIAFLLGGGNLLKVHLKKVFTQQAGWAYSLITVIAFAVTLWVGLVKWGVPPAAHLEHPGETFAPLPLEEFPFTYSVPGELPEKQAPPLPASVRRQLTTSEGNVVFRGWMLPDQRSDLLAYNSQLRWQCLVEQLAQQAQVPERFRGKLAYYPDFEVLAFRGSMTEQERAELESLSPRDAWRGAVAALYEASQRVWSVSVDPACVPPRLSPEKLKALSPALEFEPQDGVLQIRGPMGPETRRALLRQFPLARPMPADSPARKELLQTLQAHQPLTESQLEAFHTELDRSWTVPQLLEAVRMAGVGVPRQKSACEMFAEQQQGVQEIRPTHPHPPDQTYTQAQAEVIQSWAGGSNLWLEDLEVRLAEVSGGQVPVFLAEAVAAFFARIPTEAEQKKSLCIALLRAGPLSEAQKTLLLEDYSRQWRWRWVVGELFAKSNPRKFPWSGQYNAPGSPFWWIYEYMFKPLTATMFALLAFYVASAAFRAFRAKNLEATLLLGTAFVVLLGRTAAGTLVTGWLPDWLAWLRVENLTVTIMSVFNTAGARAIMIGIALGIVATSLKVILGMDRSYLGSGDQ